jgi:hypothetical protein
VSSRAVVEDQWYQHVNQECSCAATTKCGSKLKAIVAEIRAGGAMPTAAQRQKLTSMLHTLKRSWYGAKSRDNNHNKKFAAVCDCTAMPRELLPRLYYASNYDDACFPYVAQSTVNDVRAMRFIRSKANTNNLAYKEHWAALQPRLAQYAATGSGSIAEAIVYNDCQWLGQQAHERPSGGKSTAARNRKKTRASSYADSSNSSNADVK